MTNAEKVEALLNALEKIEDKLGIRRDFVPLGHALEVAQIIHATRKSISDNQPHSRS